MRLVLSITLAAFLCIRCTQTHDPTLDPPTTAEAVEETWAPFTFSTYEDSHSLSLAFDTGGGWKVWEELEYLGNGYDWRRLFRNYVQRKNPELLSSLTFDPEAEYFVVQSQSLDSLRVFANLVSVFVLDMDRLREAIQVYAKY